ncbi:HU family DNA-binding protein [Pseudoalteromonas denitrificans]|jgi:nucleoid DNA-binding protein|uniref:DNA-binding protein HU-beta n=1 Tax=Pseudoalteromonas denitrificans DSM 6059 TaxID=1123010 RepID=A0A1I1KK67_9GAMM|nr:HU family DNA-binding protein [Pseudoalteromonas denitrificans]SFC61266.1 DNA-binding protein HU-beta [Pseudoalteromonas denitrificans DSM 6059]
MNKTQLIAHISKDSEITKAQAKRFYDAFVATITKQLYESEIVQLTGFGTFSINYRPERQGRNPKTGQPITIEASLIPTFKPGKALKDICSK